MSEKENRCQNSGEKQDKGLGFLLLAQKDKKSQEKCEKKLASQKKNEYTNFGQSYIV